MGVSRRAFLLGVSAGAVWGCVSRGSGPPDAVPTRPDPKTFQAGDLVWPKKPGQVVPFNTNPTSTYENDRRQWEREKAAFVQRVREARDPSPEDRAAADALEGMSFDEFLSVYLGGTPRAFGLDFPIYIGHVGMIFKKDGQPWVLEAVEQEASRVRQIPYQEWLGRREGAWVWHRRLKRDEQDRNRVAVEALKYLDRRYDFWNLNLNDDRGFYCSKLVWLAVYRALNFAMDDNPNPRRSFWYSPKQLLHSPHVIRLLDPGPYVRPPAPRER